MPKQSAGILLYRFRNQIPEVFLIHPGGPFWKSRDAGAWQIPKGELQGEEEPIEAAKREFFEETGSPVSGNLFPLQPIKQKGGKEVLCFTLEGDIDANTITSNEFEMEWPPSSGKMKSFPEVDRAAWFSIGDARIKILPSQLPLIDQLMGHIN
jgi:predicted NUDIX family NTP pyrophosphohydrolase